MTTTFSLLVVDDEPDLRTLYELTLLREGYDVDSAGSVEEAWARLGERGYNAVITDMRLPDGNGLDLLRRLEAAGRPEKTIVITAYGSAENAVEALKAGAFDYLTKPVDLRQFRSVVASALGRSPAAVVAPEARAAGGRGGAGRQAAVPAGALAPAPAPTSTPASAPASTPAQAPAQAPPLAPGLSGDAPAALHPALQRLAGASPAMQQVRSLIERVARGMAPVMVQGESGTGKELVARALHEVSTRADQPFIAVNCGAIPEQLIEAEFFGYRKGAFTGANEDRAGFFQAAQGGTLFLDEIGDLPLAMQSKLLRAIQERSVRQIGAVVELPVNVRIVSATHKDLAVEVHEGRFRQDLYYRLNVIQVRMPPLRDRVDDLALICAAVLHRIARDAGVTPAPRLAPAALEHLSHYGFPGNVRELENLLYRAVTLAGAEVIERDDLGLGDEAFVDSEWQALESPGVDPSPAPPVVEQRALPRDLVDFLDATERDVIVHALVLHRNNRTAAGSALGLSLRQMRYRMVRLGINPGDHGPE